MNLWQGKNIRLRALEPEDYEIVFEWEKDTDMNRDFDVTWFPYSREFTKNWTESIATDDVENDAYFWVIEDLNAQFAGWICSHTCYRRNGTFKYGVAIRHGFERKGYAKEAAILVMRFFFDELRYQKCGVNINANNPGSLKFHEQLGFLEEGRLRRVVYTQGQYLDEMLYGMTIEEFRELYPAASEQDDESPIHADERR